MKELFFQLEKFNAFEGIATGIFTAQTVDRDRERLNYAKSKPYFEAWSASVKKDSGGKSLGNVRRQHDDKIVAGKLTNIEFLDDAQIIRGEAKIIEPVTKELLDEGALTGFSIGGRYVDKWMCDDGVTEYVADPVEISVVDRPALPEAVFQSVKSDGTIELRKFAKYEAAAKAEESFDQIRMRVQGALDEKYQVNDENNPRWVWIKDMFAGSVVFSVQGKGTGDGELFEAQYSEADGKVTLSDPIEVIGTYVPANKSVRYLVPDGEHLPYTDENGNISHRLMGAAWAALHGGYRGNKYEGPDKDKAIARLKRLYESEGMETPDASKAISTRIDLADTADMLKNLDIETLDDETRSLLKAIEDQLEKMTMPDDKDKDLALDKAARHSVHQKIAACKAAHTAHLEACKAHHAAMHAHLDGISKVLGGGPESTAEGGQPEHVSEGRGAGAPQAAGASDTADKGVKFVEIMDKDGKGTGMYKKFDPNAPPPTAAEIAKEVAKAILEVQKAATDAIGDRSKVTPFRKADAVTKTDDAAGAAAAGEQVEKMTDEDWKAYGRGDAKAIAKAQRCTAQKWQPTPSRIANREAARVGVASA